MTLPGHRLFVDGVPIWFAGVASPMYEHSLRAHPRQSWNGDPLIAWRRSLNSRGQILTIVGCLVLPAACGSRSTLDDFAKLADIESRPDAAAKTPVCESARVSIDDLRPTITLLVDQWGA